MPHYRTGMVARGVESKGMVDNTTIITIIAATSNLPLLTPYSLLGRHVKLHTFLSAHSPDLSTSTTNLTTSWGVGLVGKIMDFARVELNYCVPVWGHGCYRPGVRLSFNTHWL